MLELGIVVRGAFGLALVYYLVALGRLEKPWFRLREADIGDGEVLLSSLWAVDRREKIDANLRCLPELAYSDERTIVTHGPRKQGCGVPRSIRVETRDGA